MAECNFNFNIPGSLSEALQKAKYSVEKQGGSFNGDEAGGNFSLSIFGQNISGNYAATGNELNVIISEKPFMVPCSAIESFLQKQFS